MNSKGSDTLLQASLDCKFRLLRTVIEGGTAVDIWDDNRQTPLMLACSSAVESENKGKVIHYLLKKNARVNMQDLEGRTALMHACISNSSPSVIQYLIDNKANPWLEDKVGCTSFDHAINGGNSEITRLLVHSCREHKLLLKTDNAVEMKQEMRKVSWPLMGPSVRNTPAQLYCSQDASLLATDSKLSVEAPGRSPRLDRRRKRSVCYFDPLHNDEITQQDGVDKRDQPACPTRVQNTTAGTRGAVGAPSGPCERTRAPSLSQMTEEERISFHFSSTESSAEEPGSGLVTLLKLEDSFFDSNDGSYPDHPEINIVTNELGGGDSATVEKYPSINRKRPSSSKTLQYQRSTTEEAPLSQEEPKGIPFNTSPPCKASRKPRSVHRKVSPFPDAGDRETDSLLTQDDSAVDKTEANRTKQQRVFDLEHYATKEHAENDNKRCHTLTSPAVETSHERNESLSSLTTAATAKISPKLRRKTLPNGPATPSERQTPGRQPRRSHTLSSTDVSKLCSSFASQRLSPTPRDSFAAENRKSPTPRDMSQADEVFHSPDELMFSCTRFGTRSPSNDSNTGLETVKKSEPFPTLPKESTGKGVQLPVISLQRKSPRLQINTRSSAVISREEITDISPRNEELLHIEQKCASPTNRGRISPFSGRKSPLAAKYEACSASAPDTRGKPAHKTHTDAFPGRRQHSPSGKVEQDGTKHGSIAIPQSSLEENDQQKLAPLRSSKDSSKKPSTLLPPLRINNTFFSSIDSEEGYYSCSPSPFDVESPKRTPGHSEQPRYLFRPISPRSAVQRFNSD